MLQNVRQPSMMASMARRLGNLVLSSGYDRWPALREGRPAVPFGRRSLGSGAHGRSHSPRRQSGGARTLLQARPTVVGYENRATPHFYGVSPFCSFMRTGRWRLVRRTQVAGAHLHLEGPRGTGVDCISPFVRRSLGEHPRHPATPPVNV
ncbi:hypothetical protein L226DRAFT_215103 [Lentinus tigrinus ALCF2SS1-7]|uniref:uncharacterized protein n=1 Tax=Lentinus tigrinus ALCF2SS1-7 TaxID=1328758 RepID=UPI001165EDCC|nr:hypothetical protein L226DRAFT_215103 [Lentinus tigrinus ALCF2SS1-7]